MKAEHYSEELDPNCKEKGREGSVTQIANIKNEANRPRNRATTPNISPLSATPSSATQKINATRADREAQSKKPSSYSSNDDSKSTKHTI